MEMKRSESKRNRYGIEKTLYEKIRIDMSEMELTKSDIRELEKKKTGLWRT